MFRSKRVISFNIQIESNVRFVNAFFGRGLKLDINFCSCTKNCADRGVYSIPLDLNFGHLTARAGGNGR